MALLALALSCRRARGGVALGRHSSVVVARFLGAVRSVRRLAPSACGRWRGRFLSGRGRRRTTTTVLLPTALTAPLAAAPRWRSWRRLGRAAARAAARRSASALPQRQVALSTRGVVLSGSRSLRVVVGAVVSSLVSVAVARRLRRRCLRRALALLAPAQSCSRARSGVALGRRPSAAAARSLGTLGTVRRAQRLALSACGRWRGRFLTEGGRRRAALTSPLPVAPRWRSWRRLSRAAALAAA